MTNTPTPAPLSEQPAEPSGDDVRDALMDSQYLAGVTAGWNAAQSDNPNEALAQLRESRRGYLAPITRARRDKAPSEQPAAPDVAAVLDRADTIARNTYSGAIGWGLDEQSALSSALGAYRKEAATALEAAMARIAAARVDALVNAEQIVVEQITAEEICRRYTGGLERARRSIELLRTGVISAGPQCWRTRAEAAEARASRLEAALKGARDEFARIDCQGFNFISGIDTESRILQKCKEFAARGFACTSDALSTKGEKHEHGFNEPTPHTPQYPPHVVPTWKP